MAVSEAQKRAKEKYEKKSYDKCYIRLRKDGELTRDKITEAATEANESLNQYILKAIEERMERQKNGGMK